MAKHVVSTTIIAQKRKEGMEIYYNKLFNSIEVKLELAKLDCLKMLILIPRATTKKIIF